MILPVKFVLTSPIAELGEHWAPLKISPWGWDMSLHSLILNAALLDHPALEIWISTEMSSWLFCQISQRAWIVMYAILMLLYQVYACYEKVEVLWSSKKPATMYPDVLNKYEMTKWVYTHIADRLREKHFLSWTCSIFRLAPASLKMSWLYHSITAWVSQALPTWCLVGGYRLCLCELCVGRMGSSCNLAIVQLLLACCCSQILLGSYNSYVVLGSDPC